MLVIKNSTPQIVSYTYNENPIRFSINGNVMVNATQMAKSFGKRPSDWIKTEQSINYVGTYSKVKNIVLTDLMKVNYGGKMPGTWMHEDVALEFARWLSPEFAIWCNDRIKEILLGNVQPQPKQLAASNKYQKQKIDTYVSLDEKVLLQQACAKLGYTSTYQLLQQLICNFLNGNTHLHEIKQLKDDIKYLEKQVTTWQNMIESKNLFYQSEVLPFVQEMNRTIADERALRKQAEQKLLQIKAIA